MNGRSHRTWFRPAVRKVVVAVVVVVALAGCAADSDNESATSAGATTAPETQYLPTSPDYYTYSAAAPSYEDDLSSPVETPSLSSKQEDKFIKLLFGQYTKEWVTQGPDEWVDLATTTCAAYRRGQSDSDLYDILSEQLTDGAARWFLASTKTLVCPDVD